MKRILLAILLVATSAESHAGSLVILDTGIQIVRGRSNLATIDKQLCFSINDNWNYQDSVRAFAPADFV